MTTQPDYGRILQALERIAFALEAIAKQTDPKFLTTEESRRQQLRAGRAGGIPDRVPIKKP